MSLEAQFRSDVSPLPSSVVVMTALSAVRSHTSGGPDISRCDSFRSTALGPVRHAQVGGAAKRIIDITLALSALIVLAPIMLVIAVVVRLSMGGGVIFSQERIGAEGRRFMCWKFRTMPVDADEILRRHLIANADAAREWRETRKLKDDPRVGCLARVLRKSSLDELPQLFNVLRGDMSIVGPRPIVGAELHYYGTHLATCFRARPGLTGMWQVSGRNRIGYGMRVALDRYYVRRWSLALDLRILLRTLPALVDFDTTS